MQTLTAWNPRNNQHGFTYVMVLVAVVVLGIVIEAATVLSSQAQRAEQEVELLYRGMAYRNAIRSYYRANGAYPRSLEDLVRDNRHPGKRHLRLLHPDPLSKPGAEDNGWILVRDTGGGIRGVTSASKSEPRKKANFPKDLERFENSTSYAQWIFEYIPETPVRTGMSPPTPVGPPVRTTN